MLATNLYWCKSCGVPLLSCECENCGQEGIKICSDLKPMFKKECAFLENETGAALSGNDWQHGLWMRTVRGKVSSEDLSELINKQKIVLDMLEEREFISQQEKEELILRKEELPEWRYES